VTLVDVYTSLSVQRTISRSKLHDNGQFSFVVVSTLCGWSPASAKCKIAHPTCQIVPFALVLLSTVWKGDNTIHQITQYPTCRYFINIFSKRLTSFHRLSANCFELNFFMRNTVEPCFMATHLYDHLVITASSVWPEQKLTQSFSPCLYCQQGHSQGGPGESVISHL